MTDISLKFTRSTTALRFQTKVNPKNTKAVYDVCDIFKSVYGSTTLTTVLSKSVFSTLRPQDLVLSIIHTVNY